MNRTLFNVNNNQKHVINRCNTCKSLPSVLSLSLSNRSIRLKPSKSLHSCFKFTDKKSVHDNKNLTKIDLITTKKLNPTIGELLGDDDLFHKRFYSARFKRKEHHHHSYSQSFYSQTRRKRRKYQRSNYNNTKNETRYQSCQIIDSTPNINQIYLYPTTTYSYTPSNACCYYGYSSMSYCCPYLLSHGYTGPYQQEAFSDPSIFQ